MAERDGIFTEVVNDYVDRHKRGQELQRIGEQVVRDCAVYGTSVWKRNEDGSITPVDPASVVFQVNERAPIPPYRELTDAEEAAEEATWD